MTAGRRSQPGCRSPAVSRVRVYLYAGAHMRTRCPHLPTPAVARLRNFVHVPNKKELNAVVMSKRARSEPADAFSTPHAPRTDRVVLDVGGETFVTTASTLTGSSSYFARLLSSEWKAAASPDSTIFLDRDAEPFKVLLSFMRSGKPRMPNDPEAFAAIMHEAEYLGVDALIAHVKCTAQRHHRAGVGRRGQGGSNTADATAFDEEHSGIDGAFASGVLPARYFGPPPKGPKISQLVPAAEPLEVRFGTDDEVVLPVMCHALVESNGVKMEPVVCRPDKEAGYDDQLVLASAYAEEIEVDYWSVHRQSSMHVLPKGALVAATDDNNHEPVVMCRLNHLTSGEAPKPTATFFTVEHDGELVDATSMPKFARLKAVQIPNKVELAQWDLLDIKCRNGETANNVKTAAKCVLGHG